jgi:ATP-dependent Clp protease ATP-binding subunit ClpA
MDLNLAMRYVMVQAQREAAGNSVKADHLFLGLLTLGKKNASDITPDAQVQSRISGDMQNVKNLFETHHISMDDTGEKLRFLLNVDPSQAETDASNLLLQAMDTCKQQGKTEVAASVVLELILKSPTTLIGKVLASPPVDKPQGIQKIFQITGESPKKAETVFQKNESVMPEPKPIPEPKPKPEPNAPVFFFFF